MTGVSSLTLNVVFVFDEFPIFLYSKNPADSSVQPEDSLSSLWITTRSMKWTRISNMKEFNGFLKSKSSL